MQQRPAYAEFFRPTILRTIRAVPHNGMANRRAMDSNLMGSAGFWIKIQERDLLKGFHHFKRRFGWPPAVGNRHPARNIFRSPHVSRNVPSAMLRRCLEHSVHTML